MQLKSISIGKFDVTVVLMGSVTQQVNTEVVLSLQQTDAFSGYPE